MASEIKVDTISEKTSAGGVTIDGLLIKDGGISGDVSLIGTTPTFTIGDAGAEDAALVFDGNAKDFYVALDDSADKLVIGEGSTVGTNSILTITDDSVTIGDAAAVDTKIVFDGNAQDFYVGLDDSADDLVIGLGSAVGTTPAISINSDRDVTISDGAIDFDVASHDGSNGLKLAGTLVTATAAEMNLLDGGTSVGSSITLADADGFVVNDGGTMKTIPASDISTYAGGGKVLQIQSAKIASATSVTSTTATATNLTDAITPSASDSKILVIVDCIIGMSEGSGTGNVGQVQLFRDIGGAGFSNIYRAQDNASISISGLDAGTNVSSANQVSMVFLDSPSTTSACTYTQYLKLNVASASGDSINSGPSSLDSTMTLIEIGA